MILESIIKLVLILVLGMIAYQDIKERMVTILLFPLLLGAITYLHFQHAMPEVFLSTVALNLCLIGIIVLVLFAYIRLKLRIPFLKAFALGDVLFLICTAFTFATVSYITLLVFSFIFSLVLHFILKRKNQTDKVPLAGYMALFFSITYITYWLGLIDSLYLL